LEFSKLKQQQWPTRTEAERRVTEAERRVALRCPSLLDTSRPRVLVSSEEAGALCPLHSPSPSHALLFLLLWPSSRACATAAPPPQPVLPPPFSGHANHRAALSQPPSSLLLTCVEHVHVHHGRWAKLTATRILAAPWPSPLQLLVVPLSVPTQHGIAFSRSRHTSCIPLPVAFVTGAPRH
jgi:hypothetical protein